jgi:hypothetical protein
VKSEDVLKCFAWALVIIMALGLALGVYKQTKERNASRPVVPATYQTSQKE